MANTPSSKSTGREPLPPRRSLYVIFCIANIAFLIGFIMRVSNSIFSSALLISSASSASTSNKYCQASNNDLVYLSWHPPTSSPINDLSRLFNATGTYGYIFNSSEVPEGVTYGTYNYCNMPRVRSTEYVKAPAEFRLKYVELVGRSSLSPWTFLDVISDPQAPQTNALCVECVSRGAVLLEL